MRQALRAHLVIFLLCVLFVMPALHAAEEASAYVPETDPLVLRKLAQWQDWKFGFLMHWGPYSQWGIVESWSICSEDVPWCERPKGISYVDYVRKYEQLPTTFPVISFDDPHFWHGFGRAAGACVRQLSERVPEPLA